MQEDDEQARLARKRRERTETLARNAVAQAKLTNTQGAEALAASGQPAPIS